MNNQYWKSDNQISKGVSEDRINAYKEKVAEYKKLTWKKKVIPALVISLVLTFLVAGITKNTDDTKEDRNEVEVSNNTSDSKENTIIYGTTEDGLYEYTKIDDTLTLTRYLGSEEEVIIPSEIDGTKVTVIGCGLFFNNKNILSVIIPSTVEEIQDGGIGSSAFGQMDKLQKITIPGSVKKIGSCTFISCDVLSEVNMEEGIEEIGYSAFEGCYKLEELTIPKSVMKLGTGCFARSGVTDITINPECEIEEGVFFFSTNGTINYYE